VDSQAELRLARAEAHTLRHTCECWWYCPAAAGASPRGQAPACTSARRRCPVCPRRPAAVCVSVAPLASLSPPVALSPARSAGSRTWQRPVAPRIAGGSTAHARQLQNGVELETACGVFPRRRRRPYSSVERAVKHIYMRRPSDPRCAADVPWERWAFGLGTWPYLNHANGVAGELAAGLPQQLGEPREILLTGFGGCWTRRSSHRLWCLDGRRLLLRHLDILEAREATLRCTTYDSTAGAPCDCPAPPAPCVCPSPVSRGCAGRMRTSSGIPSLWAHLE